MEKQFLGRNKLYVYNEKYTQQNGETKNYIKGGILNMPYELPATGFWIKKTKNGFLMEKHNNGGEYRVTRQSGRQVVISIGKIEESSVLYNCFKIDTGYEFIKIDPVLNKQDGKNIVYIRKIRNSPYICLPLSIFETMNIKKNDVMQIIINLSKEYSISIQKVENTTAKKVSPNQITTYLQFDGRNKTIFISTKSWKYIKVDEPLAIIKQRNEVKLVKTSMLNK